MDIKKQFNVILSFAIKIGYASLYISTSTKISYASLYI